METALNARIWGEKTISDKIHTSKEKGEGRGVSEANRSIQHPLTVFITVKTASEALLLHKMGYLSTAELTAAGITIPDAPKYGSRAYNEAQKKAIEKAVEDYLGIPLEQMRSKCRKRPLVFARHLAIYLLCQFTTYSLSEIGSMYGGRDHTSALHGRDKTREVLTSKYPSEDKETLTHFFKLYNFEND